MPYFTSDQTRDIRTAKVLADVFIALMEAAWRALAEEQEWLDGEVRPIDPPTVR